MSNKNGSRQGLKDVPVHGATPYDPKTFEPKPGSFGALFKEAIAKK